ncbi:hypothetical protein [Pseudoleptotrichia goodfellowii]|uniref:Uncharacterized protein n=1 Tax=Pseudoleptotrichia goodfellowii TaxID=157692 RepID=A0A510J837_9FUSO|nr:hypothetical protein [Pseudoleptotrichia goodfellowii]BBM35439.1 hypothetical protein JCM16774_0352 [Pseudoleptotrichia goodfellowii]DAS17749.1 MAG TPA: ATP-dependent Clp protease ATP-binding subunit [Caudoviricetes sp.]
MKELKCKFCKKKKMEYEIKGGRFNYDFICTRCKKRNIGTIVDKTHKNTPQG